MTKIQWTDQTWNPLVGCSRVSAGCENCYAERVAHRGMTPSHRGLTVLGKKGPRWTGEVRFLPERLSEPLRWRKPRMVFVNSMSDLFHEGVSNEQIAAVFGVMAACPQHTFQVLTKRPERMREWFAIPGTVERVDLLKHVALAGRIAEYFAEERTLPIDGWPGYWITSRGRVLSDHKGERRELAAMGNGTGHARVMLYRGEETSRPLVHRLVVTVFDGHCGEQVRHLDGDPTNNALWNLCSGTQAENWADSRRHGTSRRYSKLTAEQAADIRRLAAEGVSGAELGRRFGVSDTQARNIAKGRQWAAPSETLVWPLPSVWLGVSVENQATADARIPLLLETPAAVWWISYEPALGPVDFSTWIAPWTCCSNCGKASRGDHHACPACGAADCAIIVWGDAQLERWRTGERYSANDGRGHADIEGEWAGPHWIVIGGESGPRARPFDLAWARSTIAQCRTAGVPVFVKQIGSRPVIAGYDRRAGDHHDALARIRDRKGGDMSEWPEGLRVREMPEVLS